MKKTIIAFISLFLCTSVLVAAPSKKTDRDYWLETMLKIVDPIFTNLSQNKLRANMPVEVNNGLNTGERADVTHLEALGRSFAGIAPWLALGADDTKEGKLRSKYIDLCAKSIANAVNPKSPDYMTFDGPGMQPLVDAGFLAHGILRSKNTVWTKLDNEAQQNLVKAFKSSRVIKPYECNWLFFSAMVEAALLQITGECDMNILNHALDAHKDWYVGDGWYSDGKPFHFDYYNSYVIQPMMMDILILLKEKGIDDSGFYEKELPRFVRHAEVLERMISPEGTYPVIGRSITYRFGAFQLLAQAALQEQLPKSLTPAQVRCGLTAVIKRHMSAKSMFDKNGWLQLGVYGHQKRMAEHYISTGSLYLCTLVFLPLGLDANADFWATTAEDWSSVKVWKGEDTVRDQALYDK